MRPASGHPRPSNVTSAPRRRAVPDLVVLGVTASLIFAGLTAVDGFERFAAWSRAHETWQLDEVLMLAAVLMLATTAFAVRRWQELRVEIALREASDAAVERLEGILPICSFCKRIRDKDGMWTAIEEYVRQRSAADFSHGLCQECSARHYPPFVD